MDFCKFDAVFKMRLTLRFVTRNQIKTVSPMKAIHIFWFGAGIDILTFLIAVFFVVKDIGSPSGGTNNPTMYKALLAMGALIGAAFWLKSAGKMILANILLWIPGLPLAGYGLMILLFVIFKPDMR